MIEEIVRFQARAAPHAPAILTPTGAVSFAELDARADRLAAALQADPAASTARRFGLSVADPELHWTAILTLMRLGRVSTSLPRLGQANGAAAIAAARPDVLLRDDPSVGAEDAAGLPTVTFDAAWIRAGPELAAHPSARARFEADDLVRVVLSSGTTGVPKPVGLTRSDMDNSVGLYMGGGSGGNRLLTTLGPQTSLCVTLAFSTWARGGAMCLPDVRLDWARILGAFEPDFLVMAPADLHALVRDLPADFAPRSGMRVFTGGSAAAPEVCAAARRKLGCQVEVFYGSTEAGPLTRLRPTDRPAPQGAVGWADPRAPEVQVVDPMGRPAPPGALGEVRVRGARVACGYEDGEDRGVFADGGFHPGDLGRLAPDGLLTIEGRMSEVINLGGVKYAPMAIETVVRGCPGVLDVAAFASRSPTGEARASLALVVAADFRIEAVDLAVRSHFPRLPLHVMRLAVIPRNAMGKTEHQTLRRMAAAL